MWHNLPSTQLFFVKKIIPSSSRGFSSNLLMCIVLQQEAPCQGYCFNTESAAPTAPWVCKLSQLGKIKNSFTASHKILYDVFLEKYIVIKVTVFCVQGTLTWSSFINWIPSN